MKADRFECLDGLRGVAALSVAIFHLSPFIRAPDARMTWSAVDLFFLISGVVIETSYGRRLRGEMDGISFMKARVIRLYPLYGISTLIMILAISLAPVHGVFNNDTSAQTAFSNLRVIYALGLAGIPIWFSAVMYPLNQPAWSLFFEMAANYLYASIFPKLTKPILLVLCSGGFVGIVFQILHPQHGRLLDGGARVTFSFFLGVFIARMCPGGIKTKIPPSVILLLCTVLLFQPVGHATDLAWLVMITFFFPILVILAMGTQPRGGMFLVCRRLGQLSYPLYLFHVPVSILLFDVLARQMGLNMEHYAPWSGIILISALVVVSIAVDRFIDSPMRALLYRALIDRTSRVATVEAAE